MSASMPIRSLLALGCLALLSGGLRAQEPDPAPDREQGPDAALIKELEARARKNVAEVLKLSKKRFPSSADLGEGWFTPWNMPEDLKGLVPGEVGNARSEEDWQFAQLAPWLLFAGQKEEASAAMVRDLVAKLFPGGKPGPDLKKAMPGLEMTPELALSLALVGLRTFTQPVFESALHSTVRDYERMAGPVERMLALKRKFESERNRLNEEIDALRNQEPSAGRDRAIQAKQEEISELNRRHQKERKQEEEKMGRELLDVMAHDLKGKSVEELIKLGVGEISAIRQAADMIYLHVSAADVARSKKEPEFIPEFGQITVKLRVLTREAIRTRVKDPSEADLREKAKALEALYRRIVRMAALDQGKEEDREIARVLNGMKITVEKRKFGDHSWVVFMETPPVANGMKITIYQGRLRNGNAIVNIEGTGTRGRDWIVKEIDYFLSAMDDATRLFRE